MKLCGQVAVNCLLRPGTHLSAADHGGDHRVNTGCIGLEIVVDILLFIIDLVFSGLPEIRAEQAAAGVVKNAVNSAFGICNSEKAALAVGQARNLGELYDFTVTAFEKLIRAGILVIRYFFAALAGDVMKEEMALSDCHSFDAYASPATVWTASCSIRVSATRSRFSMRSDAVSQVAQPRAA